MLTTAGYNTACVAGVTRAASAASTAGVFYPDNSEQCATARIHVYKRAIIDGWTFTSDANYPLTFEWPAPFADDVLISDWARESVYFMTANQVIKGIGNNLFAPQNTTYEEEKDGYATATREQAIAIAVRMVNTFSKH